MIDLLLDVNSLDRGASPFSAPRAARAATGRSSMAMNSRKSGGISKDGLRVREVAGTQEDFKINEESAMKPL